MLSLRSLTRASANQALVVFAYFGRNKRVAVLLSLFLIVSMASGGVRIAQPVFHKKPVPNASTGGRPERR